MSNIINGNIEGIKDYVLEGLKTLYDIKVEKSKLFNAGIINQIAAVSFKINREKNEENVKVIVENINNNNNIEKVVNKDMKGQQEAFLKRLNERKKELNKELKNGIFI